MTSKFGEAERLQLICEAVRHCQRLRASGAPATVFSRALREPIHHLWERAGQSKDASAQYRSSASLGVARGGGGLVYDHAIPFTLMQAELLNLQSVSPDVVKPILEKGRTVALITKAEDDALNRLGLQSRMPPNWDGIDPLARYKAAGIELIPNTTAAPRRSARPVKGARAAKSGEMLTSPSDHPKLMASEAQVKELALDLCEILTRAGYQLETRSRRDGFSFVSDVARAVRIDPKIGSLRVNVGGNLPVEPPTILVHSGGQPDWLVLRPEYGREALEFLSQLVKLPK